MIYLVTYMSDQWKVKGYLALPYGYGLPDAEIRQALNRHYRRSDLTADPVSVPILPGLRDVRSRRWPALVYCRGGIGHVGRVQTHWLETFSRHGHVIFAPAYRGSESGAGRDEFGGGDVEDVLSAWRLLASLPFVDGNRISLMGFSRGSVNAARAAVSLDKPRKLAIWGGVADLAKTYEERPDLRKMLKRVIGGTPSGKPDAYTARSPVAWADQIRCPVLIIHGTMDKQVDFSHGHAMYEALRKHGKDADFHRYEGCGHHFPPQMHEIAVERMFHWINH